MVKLIAAAEAVCRNARREVERCDFMGCYRFGRINPASKRVFAIRTIGGDEFHLAGRDRSFEILQSKAPITRSRLPLPAECGA
jgi:hypothetical protein